MCAMRLNILYTNDYGVHNHACDSGPFVSAHFNDFQDIINYITNSIHQAYHVGGELYDDANKCKHGYNVKYIIMEIVRYNEDPDDDDEPLVVTFDVYNHHRTYNQMVQEFFDVHDGVDRISELFL